MGMTEVLGLLGGLALFLYGMQMMSDGLEAAAGNRMKAILEKLTANRFLGVVVGAGITAVIQSSSATTVMVVGFVNSGMMTLKQAVWIIMGANIGTTITAQLVTLDMDMIAPLIAFVGVAMVVFLKSPKMRHIGRILAGFGILFLGMDMMGTAMKPLRDFEPFIELMATFSNPIIGILVGAGFTALVQSSSAAIGILQTLAEGGLLPFSSAVFILFGSNIGTCITAVLAALGTNRAAKRTTLIHLMFNMIGTIVFTLLCISLPLADFVGGLTPGRPDVQIANMHTFFNITTTILLIPFGSYMATLAEKILPDVVETVKRFTLLGDLTDEYRRGNFNLGQGAVYMDLLDREVGRMLSMASETTYNSYQVVLDRDVKRLEKLDEVEDVLDGMNREISQYISNILVQSRVGNDVFAIKELFLITGNAERIGDHANNIGGYVKEMDEKAISFSEIGKREIMEMQAITKKAIGLVLDRGLDATEMLTQVSTLEQTIDDMTVRYREQHLERMHRGECSEEACVLYSELLTDFERIGDHVLNIAQSYAKIAARA
ncbi:MAG: Na/Pi cotransporter family protein [Lachnospiraceae bacterium]|nr:Na/Pi cotransporter family protein [Lachnospiraceae bacterium]